MPFAFFVRFAAIFFLLGITGFAGTIAYEAFNPPAGTQLKDGADSPSDGFSGAWTQTSSNAGNAFEASPSLQYGGMAASGNRLDTNLADGSISAVRGLDNPIPATDGTEFWVSALVRWNSSSGATKPPAFNLVFAQATTLDSGSGFILQYSNLNDIYRITRVGSTGTTAFGTDDKPGIGVVDLLVAQILYKAGTDTVRLFVNPGVNTTPGDADLDGTWDQALPSIGAVGLTITTSTLANWSVDEIRIGTSFADVSPIPEPATSLLSMCGALGLLSRRR